MLEDYVMEDQCATRRLEDCGKLMKDGVVQWDLNVWNRIQDGEFCELFGLRGSAVNCSGAGVTNNSAVDVKIDPSGPVDVHQWGIRKGVHDPLHSSSLRLMRVRTHSPRVRGHPVDV